MATTEERIIEAAEKLEAQGVNPTQVSVREAMGGGSFATIGPALKRWKESKKEDDKLAEVHVPEAITERLEQLQGAVWRAAVDEADRRLMAEREALHQAQEAAAAEVREHLDSIAALETEAVDYQRKIEALEDQAETLGTTAQSLEDELGSVSNTLIQERERREAAQREIEQMRERMEKLEEKADTAVQEAAELRGELRALKKEEDGEPASEKPAKK